MSTYKQFTAQDVIITPFYLGKKFAYTGDQITASFFGVFSIIPHIHPRYYSIVHCRFGRVPDPAR